MTTPPALERSHVCGATDTPLIEATIGDFFADMALRQGERFCAVSNPRAWLFEVARNAAVDHARRTRSSAGRTMVSERAWSTP